jgi:hemoglobin-like flavoprotein
LHYAGDLSGKEWPLSAPDLGSAAARDKKFRYTWSNWELAESCDNGHSAPIRQCVAAHLSNNNSRKRAMTIVTPHQVELVQSSFAKVVPIAETAATLFYGRLFEIAPEVRPMFRGDMQDQGRKLMTTLNIVVRSLGRLSDIMPAVRALAVKHVSYGVVPRHYEVVGDALIWTLQKGLGPDFTPEVRAAWVAVYNTLASAMIAEAYREKVAA